MKSFRKNIAGKLTIPSTIGIVLILILFSLAMIRNVARLQERQLHRAISILNYEKEKQDALLRENLSNYTRLIGEMLILVAPEKMMTLDYEALDQVALLAQKDPNITYIKFKDADGIPLTTQKVAELNDGDYTIHHDIVSWGEKLGEVEVGITNDRLKVSIDEIEEVTRRLIRQEEDEKAKTMKGMVRVSILFTIATCVVSSLVILLSSRLITGPLSILLDGIQRIRHNDFSHPVNVDSLDELGEVAKIFDLMRIKLQQTLLQLQEHQEQLENKVASRTKELQCANYELVAVNKELHSAMKSLQDTQEELLKAEKYAVVGQMSGIVAHEVLNPITTISLRIESNVERSKKSIMVIGKLRSLACELQAQFMSAGLKDDDAETVMENLKMLQKIAGALEQNQQERSDDFVFLEKQISRVLRIVDGLRQMAKSTKVIENIKIETVINEVVADMDDSLKKRQVTVERRFEKVQHIQADHTEIYSIVSNLIRNAMQAIDKQTDIDNARTIYIDLKSLEENGAKVGILITDTGVGIAPEKWETIFEPDFTSKGREGTGLGLSYTRKLARGYDGDIVVRESERGHGTTFEVILGHSIMNKV